MDNQKINSTIKKFLLPLFNTRAAGLYILLFAASIGIATFIENDYGTSSAQKVVFKTRWFELLLILFCITLVVNIIKFRMIPLKKWALLIFHSSMIVIIIGAGVTRNFGYEGMMHIREDDQSNTFLSAETYLNFEVLKGKNKYTFEEPVLFATLGNNEFEGSYLIGNDLVEVKVKDFIPNPVQVMKENETQGVPTLKIVMAGASGREEYYIVPGETRKIRNLVFNFKDTELSGAINLKYENKELFIKSPEVINLMVMATQQKDTLIPTGEYYPLKMRSMYAMESGSFVFGDFMANGLVSIESENQKLKNESMAALVMDISVNGEKKSTYLYGKKGLVGNPSVMRYQDLSLAISYGAKQVTLPFYIKLYDFIMERYPGTNSAASYASEVQLVDSRDNKNMNYRIFMNNILDHDGYRFFQSSFDQDEKGTYLSVNHDFWGTWISYLGYALLTIGLIMVFFSKNTRFYQVAQKLKKVKQAAIITFLVLACQSLSAQKVISANTSIIDKQHAEIFSKIAVQDSKGRMKPMHTLTREVLRKVSRKESLNGMNADQVVLGMYAHKSNWLGVPMIKISKHEALHDLIGVSGDLASYKDFFNVDGSYKLREEIRRVYGLQPIDRGTYEKDIMKIDERINIVSMVYSGRLFKIIPVAGDANNTWVSTEIDHESGIENVPVADRFFASFAPALAESLQTGNYSLPNTMLQELVGYQNDKGAAVVPSSTDIYLEIFLNKMNVFSRLSLYYSLLGLAFLTLLFVAVFKPELKLDKGLRVLIWLAAIGFAFHTLGLGIRWYVSGRAPWSNGYESMIYIAWTTTLAGLIFTRKSTGGMAATMILAGTILLVAMLSYLDPEITPLVPVLKSYWLTIHVSLIAGSYGFLMLGAIIGIINLSLMIFYAKENKSRITSMIQEMTYISEMTITGGLIMISIGTYLGGVWANESWGRYWGWDAKETWALVTILVYAFILHMRIIPKMYSLYSFNLATLFGFASVVMTYFGVNYYLSGLHSYAAGDPVPIPNWVYIAVAAVAVISLLAFWRKGKVLQ